MRDLQAFLSKGVSLMGQGAARLLEVMGLLGLASLLAGQAVAADLTGRVGLGGSVGSSLMIGDSEFRAHARPRLTFDAVFRYGLRPRLTLVGMFGYGWNAYTDEEQWLSSEEFLDERVALGLNPGASDKQVVVSPFVGGLEYRFGEEAWVPYASVGGGIYMLQLLHERRVAVDPRTLARHRTYSFGLFGRFGVEQFVSESVSIDYEALGHVIFSEDREKFPVPTNNVWGSDFLAHGGDVQFVQVRVGLRYYWSDEE
jgi:hypothetical protein